MARQRTVRHSHERGDLHGLAFSSCCRMPLLAKEYTHSSPVGCGLCGEREMQVDTVKLGSVPIESRR